MSKRHDVESRRRIVAQWRRSGQAGQGFARRAGVSYATLYRWRRELEGGTKEFVELGAGDSIEAGVGPQHRDQALEIALPAGVVVRVGPGVDEARLRAVVQALL